MLAAAATRALQTTAAGAAAAAATALPTALLVTRIARLHPFIPLRAHARTCAHPLSTSLQSARHASVARMVARAVSAPRPTCHYLPRRTLSTTALSDLLRASAHLTTG